VKENRESKKDKKKEKKEIKLREKWRKGLIERLNDTGVERRK
jgi:hypothetical protein